MPEPTDEWAMALAAEGLRVRVEYAHLAQTRAVASGVSSAGRRWVHVLTLRAVVLLDETLVGRAVGTQLVYDAPATLEWTDPARQADALVRVARAAPHLLPRTLPWGAGMRARDAVIRALLAAAAQPG